MMLRRLVQQLHMRHAQDETVYHGTPGREVEPIHVRLRVFPQTRTGIRRYTAHNFLDILENLWLEPY